MHSPPIRQRSVATALAAVPGDGGSVGEVDAELKCGVAAIDVRSGQIIGLLEFQTAVEEIFDVQLLPGLRFPEVIGFQKETLHHAFVMPNEHEQSGH